MDTALNQVKTSILIVDDYAVTLRILSTQLRKGGYEVVTAGNGKEAISHITDRNFDMAIIDIAMPDMDGITLLEKLRTEHGQSTLPIIMLTASALDEDRVRAQAAGATDFLTKPISSWELLDAIQRQLTNVH